MENLRNQKYFKIPIELHEERFSIVHYRDVGRSENLWGTSSNVVGIYPPLKVEFRF